MAPRVAIITGCSSGIGLSTAVMLAQDPNKGYIVYATMRNLAKKENLEKAAGSALNKTLFIIALDVTKHDTITAAVNKVVKEQGRLDILVNNAGIASFGVFEHVDFDKVRGVMETNFFGVLAVTREVIPQMKKQKSGRIITVSSQAGLVGLPLNEVYCASKFAVEGFTESLAPTLRPHNIWISTVQPGMTQTAIVENMGANKQPDIAALQSTAFDPITKQVVGSMLEMMGKMMTTNVQSGDDIARAIKGALEDEKPHVRYQTSEVWNAYPAMKYKDTTGDPLVDQFAETLKPK